MDVLPITLRWTFPISQCLEDHRTFVWFAKPLDKADEANPSCSGIHSIGINITMSDLLAHDRRCPQLDLELLASSATKHGQPIALTAVNPRWFQQPLLQAGKQCGDDVACSTKHHAETSKANGMGAYI